MFGSILSFYLFDLMSSTKTQILLLGVLLPNNLVYKEVKHCVHFSLSNKPYWVAIDVKIIGQLLFFIAILSALIQVTVYFLILSSYLLKPLHGKTLLIVKKNHQLTFKKTVADFSQVESAWWKPPTFRKSLTKCIKQYHWTVSYIKR